MLENCLVIVTQEDAQTGRDSRRDTEATLTANYIFKVVLNRLDTLKTAYIAVKYGELIPAALQKRIESEHKQCSMIK